MCDKLEMQEHKGEVDATTKQKLLLATKFQYAIGIIFDGIVPGHT
jgi:hypothetical protein